MKPRPRLPRPPPMNVDPNSTLSSSPSSLVSTLEYQRKQAYLEAAVAAQQQQQQHQIQLYSQQQNKQIKAVQKSIMSHQRSQDRGTNNHFINNNNNINNNTLTKHQQLQQLLKNTNDNISGNQNHNLSSSTKPSPFALNCKNWSKGSVSTSQAPPSMPTSLLNLAACSSSSNQSQSPNTGSSSSARSRNATQSRVSANIIAATGNMPATRSSLIKNNSVPRSRNQASLLQDDLSRPSRLNSASNISVLQKPNVKQVQAPNNQIGPRRLSSRSNVKSDLNQSHLGSQSVTIELVSSSHSSDDRQQLNTKVVHQEKDIDSLALSRTADDSVLQPPISLGNKSRKHVNAYASGMLSDSDQLTNEVKSLVLEECNIIYECKSCSNLFRSLPNFVKHKRSFCQIRSTIPDEGTAKSRSIASLLAVDSNSKMRIEDRNSTGFTNEEQDINFSLEPNSAVVDFRPQDYENGDIVTHTYNSRGSGKRYNLINELRMMRLLQNHDRKDQQQREAARQKERSLINNETIPAETSLSKLLQSQPKARLPASQDKALIEALTIATATSPVSSNDQRNPSYEMNNLKDTVKSSSRKASSILSTKSLISVEQDNAVKRASTDAIEPRGTQNTKEPQNLTRKIAPKRKFLEDCIQKVKRDKKLVEEDDPPLDVQLTSIGSNSNAVLQTTSIDGQNDLSEAEDRINAPAIIAEVPTKIESGNNSQFDTDSDDMLTIDLERTEATKKKAQPTRSRRRSANSSSSKVSSSSALLKALTRPVLEHNQTVRDISSISSASSLANQGVPQPTRESTHVDRDDSSSWISQVDIKPTCDICNIDFENSLSLIKHNEAEHLIEKFVYPCILCSMSFILLENACRHIIEIHNKSKDQLIRLKEVVKSRSHLTTDFSTCEDYVPSKASANTPVRDTGSSISTTMISNDLTEPTVNIENRTSPSEQFRIQENSNAISVELVEEPSTRSLEKTTKEGSIDLIVDDIVTQLVDGYPARVDNTANELVVEENLELTKDQLSETEGSTKQNSSQDLHVDDKESGQDEPPHVENYTEDHVDSEIELNREPHLVSELYQSEDSHDSQSEPEQSSRGKTINPETHSTNEASCDSEVQSEHPVDNGNTFANEGLPWEKEASESSTDDMCTSDYPFASGDDTNRSDHKHEQHVHQQDKRDSRSSHNHHESSSRKHHSKDETRHGKSHDKNKSRSRSSSTEHLRSEERTHHRSSNNQHNSSAKKRHQSKSEPKTSPVPSAEPIMKLKIQLKTRPDEKCKVYEIV